MRAFLVWVVVLSSLWVGTSLATPPVVKVTPGLIVERGDFVVLEVETDADGAVRWYVPSSAGKKGLSLFPSKLTTDKRSFYAIAKKVGTFRVVCFAANLKGEISDPAECMVTVEDPETPPTPTPGPVPPGPAPAPTPPAPIPASGFRTLIIYDSSALPTMPAVQQQVLYGKAIRDYLNEKCVLGTDGRTHEWRIWDKDTDYSGENRLWQDAMKKSHPSMPWIMISNGVTGFEGSLPATVEDTLTLLKKYGG